MHTQQGWAAHHPLGRRTSARSHAGSGSGGTRKGRAAQTVGRASLRDDQMRHEPGLLPPARPRKGQGRDTCTCSAGASVALTVMAYDLKRAIKILGVPRMILALA